MKQYTSPFNEFLLHKCRNNRKIKKYKFIFVKSEKKCTSPANEFLLHASRRTCKNATRMHFPAPYTPIHLKIDVEGTSISQQTVEPLNFAQLCRTKKSKKSQAGLCPHKYLGPCVFDTFEPSNCKL